MKIIGKSAARWHEFLFDLTRSGCHLTRKVPLLLPLRQLSAFFLIKTPSGRKTKLITS